MCLGFLNPSLCSIKTENNKNLNDIHGVLGQPASCKMTSRGSLSPADQPYNIILAGAYGVGKTGLFKKLSGEVHSDYQYRTVPSARDASRTTGQQFGHWTHTALVDGDTVKVGADLQLLLVLKGGPC